MAEAKDLYVGCPVIISRPGFTQGGRSYFQEKTGVIKWLSGGFCQIKIDGEVYGFFACEVDRVE